MEKLLKVSESVPVSSGYVFKSNNLKDKIENLRTKVRIALEEHSWELYELSTAEDKSEIYVKLLRWLDNVGKKYSDVVNMITLVEEILEVVERE